MIVVVEPYNAARHATMLIEMFRLRARVFGDRLGWDVAIVDGQERDRYDDEAPVYVIHVDERSGSVKGALRLLPTTGPTLLADFFADTVPESADISAPTIWECTRFCLDNSYFAKGAREEMSLACSDLLVAIGELAVKAGIESILGNFDAPILRLYRQLGCEVEVLGVTHRYGRPVHLGSFPVSSDNVRKLKDRRNELLNARGRATAILAA